MTRKNKKTNAAGNTNKSGGSYKEKQPMTKSNGGQKEISVDEDGDGRSDHSVSQKQRKTKTSV